MKKPCIEVQTHFQLYRLHLNDIKKLSKIVMPTTPPLPTWQECLEHYSHQKEDFIATIDQEQDQNQLNLTNK